MKILHVVRQFAPAVGGLETYVKSMALRQAALGHKVEVLTLNRVFHGNGARLPAHETIDGIRVRRVGFIGVRRFFLPLVAPAYFSAFDIVHVHNTDMFFDLVSMISRFTRKPVFATTHGGFFHTKDFSLFKSLYFKWITRFSSRAYETIFAISQNDLEIFKDTNDNVILCPNAIEPMGDFIAGGKDFIYLGRLARHKNVNRLLETHALLKHKYNLPGDLHIAGPEWDVTLAELETLADHLKIRDSVHFHGFINEADLLPVVKGCGFYVSASTFEGFGMSMLEAMTVGLIPFVYPNESFTELVGQASVGTLIDFDAPEQAAAGIAAVIAQPISHDMRTQAQDFARRYSWDELTQNTLNAYADALR